MGPGGGCGPAARVGLATRTGLRALGLAGLLAGSLAGLLAGSLAAADAPAAGRSEPEGPERKGTERKGTERKDPELERREEESALPARVLRAAEEPLQTDRPDFTDGPHAVPPGWFQLESGYSASYDREEGARTITYGGPQMLARVGLVPDLELRLGWGGWDFLLVDGQGGRHDSANGASDLYAGLKWALWPQDGAIPAVGLIPAVTVPVGSEPFTSDGLDPQVKAAYGWDALEWLEVEGNVNLVLSTVLDERQLEVQASLSCDVRLADSLEVFLEYFGLFTVSDPSSEEHYADTGLTFLLSRDVQLDASAGLGLDEAAVDFFGGVGLSFRFCIWRCEEYRAEEAGG